MKKRRIAAVTVLLVLFAILTWSITKPEMLEFEKVVYRWFAGFINPQLTKIVIAITNMGSHLGVIAAVAVLLLLPSTRMPLGAPIVANVWVAACANLALKLIIARPRPEVLRLVSETGYGFPSGHAMNNAAFYAMLALVVVANTKSTRLKLAVVAFSTAMTFLIGISRIYLGVHNTADVLAGWVLGLAISLCVDTAWQLLKSKYKPPIKG